MTGQTLRSKKYAPNILLKRAIEKREKFYQNHPNEKTASWYCIMPPAATCNSKNRLLCPPATQVRDWVDGKYVSRLDPEKRLHRRELLVPNLAVVAMVQDAGYPTPAVAETTEKYTIYTKPSGYKVDDVCLVAAAGAASAALFGAGFFLPLFYACHVKLTSATFALVAPGSAVGGAVGAGLGASCYQMRRDNQERDRINNRPPFSGP